MSKKFRQRLWRIIATIILLIGAVLFLDPVLPPKFSFIAYLLIYFVISTDVIYKSFQNVIVGEVFDENLLMLIASVGAFAISEYKEGIAVILLYQIGELFQDIAVQKSKRSIKGLLNLQSDVAHVWQDEHLVNVKPQEVAVGTEIIVKTGERIPLDGVLESKNAELNMAALTGESMPVEYQTGDILASGAINLGSEIRIRTTASFNNSTVSKMARLVEEATTKKAKSEEFITKFARIYTPTVVVLAILVATVPLIFTGLSSWQMWLYRALIFLVVSCPCALVISVPLTFFAGLGGFSKKGILVKGNEYVDELVKLNQIVFDKTGTLTTGHFTVSEVVSNKLAETELVRLVASVEQFSTHPIAKSIVEYNKLPLLNVENVKELSGYGLQAEYDGQKLAVGNSKLMQQADLEVPIITDGTVVYIASDNELLGYIVVKDPLKTTTEATLTNLKELGIKRYMLTGDRKQVAEPISAKLQLDGFVSDMLPEDKVNELEKIMEHPNSKTAFVGDGLNDAAVIARADVGFAMGGVGSDAAIEAADVVIMDDDPRQIVKAINIAKQIIRIVKENISFALVVKFSFLILAVFGLTTMEWAIFADVGVTVIAVLNAMRALKVK